MCHAAYLTAIQFHTLDLDPVSAIDVPTIINVLLNCFSDLKSNSGADYEFAIREREVYIPRVGEWGSEDGNGTTPMATNQVALASRDSQATLLNYGTPARCHGEGTYIIAGFGGLAKEIDRWLAELGAGNLVFLSRTADCSDHGAYLKLLRDKFKTNALGIRCNVAHRDSLDAAISRISLLPPIRGCIHSAMALKDMLFKNMKGSDFRWVLGPKVQGTWNLHQALPQDLDFFIMLSSLAGVIGYRGSGNYGAANTFQDSFAHFRRSQGLRALAIDISYVTSVGFAAEHTEYAGYVSSQGFHSTTTETLCSLITMAIDGRHPAQVMCGLPDFRSALSCCRIDLIE